ncbi:MBL fold metallo-hydrolase [uncultured Pseudoteredinibacter sp.]|uniref:MBL fold metallo-hydrolase n=1 Tax=uncultured Pseudoteredinibacter sp. TaxID=1641701 RepID=UPI002615769F|nr:MBL fold metallo-hydrolase [uncultured Pseudoteredinibacter sp.]
MKIVILALSILFIALSAAGKEGDVPDRTDANGFIEPFQMFDNVYYVGDKWVSSYLIDTSGGLVLIDTLESPYGRWIPGSIKSLGFAPQNLKYIIITHGHSDHVGNAAYLQSKFGAEVIMSSDALDLTAKEAQESKGKSLFVAPKVENFVNDGDELTVGNTKFKLYLTPGHTLGGLSIDFQVKDNGKKHRAFVVGGNGTNFKGLELAKSYVESVQRIKKLSQIEPVIEVNLASHPRMNQLFERKSGVGHDKNPYIDAKGFQEFLGLLASRGSKKLAEEMAE